MLTNYTKYINKDDNIKEYIIYQHTPNHTSLKKLQNTGNNCIRIHDKRLHPFKNLYDTYYLIKKCNPDIIHAHMSLLNFIPLFLGYVCGIRIRISHSHSTHINIKSKITEIIFKIFNIMFANVLVACGQKAGEYMYGKRNFIIIPNCVNIDQFTFNNKSRNKIRSKLNVKNDEILLGNVGRLTKQKNQLFLLEILKKLLKLNSKYKLIIIGSGEDKNKIIHKAKEYQLNDNLILHDPINNISDYYNAMDMFLLPSLYEGFPVSAIESQISGLNTIMSNRIDKTSKVLNDTQLLDINDLDTWINNIINAIYNNRYVNKKLFKKYNILYNYRLLMNLYIKLFYNK